MSGLPNHLSNDIRRGFVNINEEDDVINHTERKLRLGAALTAGLFVTLLTVIVKLSPPEIYEEPKGLDRDCHLLTTLLIFVVTCVRILQMLMKERSAGFLKSGIVVGTVTVQSIAMLSNLAMALLPCPVLYDEVTTQKTHLFRYVEWTALSFLMVFLTDNIDSNNRLKLQTAICVSLSAASGMVLPLCKNLGTWLFVFVVATILFFELYFLLYQRVVRFYNLRDKMAKGLLKMSATEHEQYDIARSSFLLTSICSTAWTILIVSYVAVCFLPYYMPVSYVSSSALSLHSCANEVLSKIWYLNTLLEAYDNIFDVNQRVGRRLEELRRFMSAIWQSSSDTIIFCVSKSPDHISARISPAFLGLSDLNSKEWNRPDVSVLLDIHPQSGTFTLFGLDLSKPFSRESALYFRRSFKATQVTKYNFRNPGNHSVEIQNVATLARHVADAIMAQGSAKLDGPHEITFRKGDKRVRCETKISSLEEGCTVFILRDISDRIERFEVEKKLIEEQAIRSKDAETNHFTRHEVKNGILASIGLLDHMRESMKKKLESLESNNSGVAQSSPVRGMGPRSSSSGSLTSLAETDAGVDSTLEELDSTLHDVLDTILDEVMAREIIYGEYKPRKERIDVQEVLSTIRRGSPALFPLELYPPHFPLLILDRQLLRHIYRNAVSNACRYGRFNGCVKTVLRYSEETKSFSMEVINEPGEGHEKLLRLSNEEVASVFNKGIQLKVTMAINSISKAASSESRREASGNGAWIMRKCAETLNGDCDIQFHQDRTVFRFECPVEAVRVGADIAAGEAQSFGLPEGTQCVVIEDSQVQRKLLDRMLQNSGIPRSNRLMLGRDSSEILGFPERVMNILEENPKDLVLLIVDENLDVVPSGGVDVETVSGSGLVKKLREDLDAQSESRLLSLVRSANDSTKDIEKYLSRAHGYLLKEPMKKGRFLEAVRPWWTKRFPNETRVYRQRGGKSEEEVCGPLPDDIRSVLDQIHSLSSNPDTGVLARRWSVIREKLQSLKGDLKTMSKDEKVLEAVHELARLHTSRLPDNYVNRWRTLREKIESLL